MRIVFIRSNPVAPYPRLEKTANSLKKKGYKIHVLAWDRAEEYNQRNSRLHLTDGDVTITRFGIPKKYSGGFKKNALPLIKFQKGILFWLFKNQNSYDVIHAYDFDTGFIALICAKLLHKKLIYDIPDYYIDSHGLKGTFIGHLVQKAENNIINKADVVIICTEKRKQQIAGTNPHKLTIIHNSPVSVSLKDDNKKKLFKGNLNKLRIVYVGILEEGRFIKELSEIIIERNDCEFHVGGFGKLESYFEELSYQYNNIYYYGRIPYSQTLELENNCDVITAMYDPKIPNHHYAAPNKFYEGLMLGKPLIMVKNTGMDDVVAENEIGEVIKYSKENLNMAINRLIENKNNFDAIAQRAKLLYEKRYSWEIMEKRLFEIYSNL